MDREALWPILFGLLGFIAGVQTMHLLILFVGGGT